MKTRITLTMDSKRVAKLRALSRRRKVSVAHLVEDLTDGISLDGEDLETDWVDGLKGALTGKFSKADLAKDARLAKVLGK